MSRELAIFNEEQNKRLKSGKYDIDYVINLCLMIEEQCAKHVCQGENFRVSLKYSLEKLRHSLEQEKTDIPESMRVIHMTCKKCNQIELVFASNAKNWVCSYCDLQDKIPLFRC